MQKDMETKKEEVRSQERVSVSRQEQKARLYDTDSMRKGKRNSGIGVNFFVHFGGRDENYDDDNHVRDYLHQVKVIHGRSMLIFLGRTRCCINLSSLQEQEKKIVREDEKSERR